MIDETRRNILRMFGIGAAAAAVSTIPTPALDSTVTHGIGRSPLETAFPPPEGMTYNWKRVFVTQDFPDFKNIAAMIDEGWKPVPWERHHGLLPSNHGGYWVEFGGLVLMEKPTDQCAKPFAHPTPLVEKPTGEIELVQQYRYAIPLPLDDV
jgi:hypothetical protein